MNLTLNKVYTILFFLGWFFFPFNDFEGLEFLGEYKNEACTYFFIFGFFILCLEFIILKKISFPFKNYLFKILLLFILWCLITTLFNYPTLIENFFKQTSGINRFLRQYISLIIATIILPFLYWNVIKNWSLTVVLTKIRTVLLISLIFVFIYGFIETLIIVFGFSFLKGILSIFDFFPFLDVHYPPGGRISSVAYESPSLGNYLITTSGWMFSYIFTHKHKIKFLPLIMILFLVFFSGSRTAFITVGIQFILLIFIMFRMKQYRASIIMIFNYFIILISILLLINSKKIYYEVEKKISSLDFKRNLTKNISNQSRFGMQYASLQVFKENPILGVGFGQEAYFKRKHYPKWATKNNWEFLINYENKRVKSFPTAYNLYTRMLAETGIIGVSIFFYLIFICIRKAKELWVSSLGETKILGFILLISFIGLSINWLQTDFFRQHGFWLALIILIKINTEGNYKIKKN